ncbi:hypothetical protein FXO37_09387 [Capsicum annuum]|nr:hypothetical protein FXO37_09387 [Capsicum annuum]
MEFPDAAELELLEANFTFPDDDDEDLIDDLDFDDVQTSSEPGSDPITSPPDPKPTLTLPPKPQLQINGRKRILTDDGNAVVITEEKKRSRVEEAEDEDWLRYSPRKENEQEEQVVVELEQEMEEEERILARYAMEIDGDCVPVTGLDGGERVYAKICRGEDERVKKLEVKGYSTGEFILGCYV